MKLIPALSASALLLIATAANSALLTPTSYGSQGGVNNTAAFADGFIPSEGTHWQTTTAWWSGTTPGLSLNLGGIFTVEDILVSVDNNDSYSVEYSTDNNAWTTLFNISSSYGDVGWGMDTMSSLASHGEYVSGIEFSAVQAQFIRIFATGGDNLYSVGELQVFGTEVSAVPVPAAAFLFAPALLGFMGLRRQAKNSVA